MLAAPGTGWDALSVRGTQGLLHVMDLLPVRSAAPHRAPEAMYGRVLPFHAMHVDLQPQL